MFASECDDSTRLVGSTDQIWFVQSHAGMMFNQWHEDFEVTGDADLSQVGVVCLLSVVLGDGDEGHRGLQRESTDTTGA